MRNNCDQLVNKLIFIRTSPLENISISKGNYINLADFIFKFSNLFERRQTAEFKLTFRFLAGKNNRSKLNEVKNFEFDL